MMEKYSSLSAYHYAGNNPIRNVDIDGRLFTDAAGRYVQQLIGEINDDGDNNNKDIAATRAQINKGGISEGKAKRLQNRIDRLTNNNSLLEQARNEIGVLATSDQVYNVVESSALDEAGPIAGMGTTVNATNFNFKTNAVDITMSPYGSIANFAHELKHGFQFEIGEISLGASGSQGISFLLDKTDEMSAYNRENLFKNSGFGNGTLPSGRYDSLPNGPVNYKNYNLIEGFQDAVKDRNKIQLNRAVKITGQAFRIDNTTYSGN